MAAIRGIDSSERKRLGLSPAIWALSILVVATAVVAIWSEMVGATDREYVFKPLTTILIVLIAVLGAPPPSLRAKRAIIAGLLFSLLGDVLLMMPADLFIFGLVAFLVAQLCYILAFVTVGGVYRSWIGLLPFALYGVVIVVLLWPNLGEMLVPALFYMVVILVMGWQALGQWRQTGQRRALLAFIGALFFIASDSALALNRFGYPFENTPLVILSTYWLAQWLIALSAGAVSDTSPGSGQPATARH